MRRYLIAAGLFVFVGLAGTIVISQTHEAGRVAAGLLAAVMAAALLRPFWVMKSRALSAGILLGLLVAIGAAPREVGHGADPEEPTDIVSASPSEVFSEADIYWTEHTEPFRNLLVTAVNNVARNNSRCRKLDPGSVDRSLSRGTDDDPVFYVTCEDASGLPFNVFFSRSEIESRRPVEAVNHVDRTTAIDLCEAEARRNTANPSTVEFSRLVHLRVTNYPNGSTRVESRFTASNAVGFEAAFGIGCLINSGGVVDVKVEAIAK